MRGLKIMMLNAVLLAACVEQEPDRPSADDQKTIKQHILSAPPATMKFKVNADLEGKVVYLGMDVDKDTIVPGEQFTLTHYWQVKQAVPGWKLFVHLNGPPPDRYFLNADHTPIRGRYQVAWWKAGEVIRDIHEVTLPADFRFDRVEVYTGLWKGNQRMKPKGPQDGENRVLAASIPVKATAATPAKAKQLIATRSAKPVKIDGKLDDAVWGKAASTGLFLETMKGGKATYATEAKVAWDDKFLYVAFDCKDDDVWTTLKKRDDPLWTQEAVEVFIDANNDGKDYVELQTNPAGTIFDSYLPAYRKNQNDWNSKMVVGISVDGTLDKRDDKDRGWTVEMAIPWADVKGRGTYELKLPPALGSSMRMNFFRLDLQKKEQHAAAWSPPLVGDFHRLDRFGEVLFGDETGKVPPRPVKPAAGVGTGVGTASGTGAEATPPAGAHKVVRAAEPPRRTVESLRNNVVVPTKPVTVTK